jgi:HNH endonuclease
MSKTNYSITQKQVAEHLHYDPDSGVLTFLTDGHKRKAGDVVSSDRNVINILGSSYSKLKLIWLLHHGEWPSGKINTKDFGSKCCKLSSLQPGGSSLSKSLSAARLREVLDYNKDTGDFIWSISMSSTGLKGDLAGVIAPDGYQRIRVDGRLYSAHRLAMLYIEGKMPPDRVDHIDWNKSNNAFSNLRHASASENAQNQHKAQSNNKASGLLGVYWDGKREVWGAKVNHLGTQHHGGFHATPKAAHQAYLHLKQQLHPFSMLEPA